MDASNLVVRQNELDGLERFAFVSVTPQCLSDFLHHTAFEPARKVQINVCEGFALVKVFPRLIWVFFDSFEVF
jgi:hypothetical protein